MSFIKPREEAKADDGVVRKDFLDGQQLSTGPESATGLVGQTKSSCEVMHALAFHDESHDFSSVQISETYDYVVVGGGVSGLAAAYFYRKRFGGDKKVLVVEALDDFGGHAKRNEFLVDGKLLIGYGGSESFQSPKTNFSAEMHGLLKELGVDLAKFENKYFKHIFPEIGLSRGSFFDSDRFEHAKKDVLVKGDPTDWVSDEIPKDQRNASDIKTFLSGFPLAPWDVAALQDLYTDSSKVTLGYLKDAAEKRAFLETTSYAAFLKEEWKLSDEAAAYFSGRTLDFFGLAPQHVPAWEAFEFGYPGFQGIQGLQRSAEAAGEMDEPYVYHFPDGNASLARLLVRALIPGSFQGSTMEDIVLQQVDRAQLDNPANAVRIRLSSSVVSVANATHAKDGCVGVDVGYVDGKGQLRRVWARHATFACFSVAVPYIFKEIKGSAQARALALNVKVPMIYSTVAVRNWKPWIKLGVHEIYGVGSFHSRVKLDYPVEIGGYSAATDPSKPCLVHMVHVPADPSAADPRLALRNARRTLFGKQFTVIEAAIRRDLDKMLGSGGFDAARDIAAITVNRWSHGYSWARNSLVDRDAGANANSNSNSSETKEGHGGENAAMLEARKRVGNVTFAGADAGWSPYLHAAVDEAFRAVSEFQNPTSTSETGMAGAGAGAGGK